MPTFEPDVANFIELGRKAGRPPYEAMTPEEARAIGERIEGPHVYMMLGGVQSMGMTVAELGKLGFKLVLDSITSFYARQKALRLSYEALAKGEPDPIVLGGYKDEDRYIHETIGLDRLLDVERRTVEQ